jgi:hypothetical protein
MEPYTIGTGRWPATTHGKLTSSWAAAALLSMDHFNARDPAVVPELGEKLPTNCTVYFPPPTLLDCAMEGITAVQALWRHTTGDRTEDVPCAVLGPMEHRTAEEVSAVTRVCNCLNCFTIPSRLDVGTTMDPIHWD